MIEKCSIGNISYNIQNITLIILILILIIVIIYYLKNSSTKHSEIIEKYTATNTNATIDTSSYQTHNDIANSLKNSQFPTEGTVVTLRDCQVQFNNDASSKYEYKDGWQEIATLKETPDSATIPITKKIISRDNQTNINDADTSVNYTEHSRCFKKMDATDNKYKYQGNNLIKYNTGNHIELQVGANGVPEKYMEMHFDLNSANANAYYTNLTNSICSLNYSTTLTGLNGNLQLIRLSLNANNRITAIDRVIVDSANNHIFNTDSTFDISSLITSGNSGTYRYNTSSPASYEYVITNSASSSLIATINLYKFDRNLLCDKTSGATTYQTIKTYTKLNDAKIDVTKIINFNLPPASRIANTTLPKRYANNITITGNGRTKDTLIANMNTLINSEIAEINSPTNISIDAAKDQKTALETTRDIFITANNTKQIFINNAIIKSNYDDLALKYNTLLNTANYNLKLGNVEYNNQIIDIEDTSITTSSSDEPTIKEILSAGEQDIYEIIEYKNAGNITIPPNTECDILIVGGGGGGARNDGAEGGGGGGGGGVIHAKIKTPASSSREIKIEIGNGGGENTSGGRSLIYYNNNTGNRIVLTADGGGTGGGHGVCSSTGSGLGKSGGSGGGGSGYCADLDGGASTGIRNKSDISNVDESLVSYTYYGNKGGLGHNQSGGGGGGGAGSAGASTIDRYRYSGRKGGDGINIPLFNNKYYGAGGGGGGGPGVQWSGYGEHGGLGGGGKGGLRSINAANGLANTGSGGGGISGAAAGSGGSGIVILRYKKVAETQSGGDIKKITLQNESITNIYRNSDSFTLNSSSTAEILVVGGGGGGGGGIGGGGGAGAVVHIPSAVIPSGNYTITVGNGGSGSYSYDKGPSDKGSPSSITGRTFNIVAEGGGGVTRGHDIGKGLVGGSGGGAAGPNQNINTGGAAGTSSLLGGFSGTIYGNRGGNNTEVRRGNWTNATGGGGAGAAAADTDPSSWQRGNGGDGKMFNITGVDVFYGGGGGGGGHPIAGSGGLGGGGDGSAQGGGGGEGGAGQDNTGGGGGGGCWAVTMGGKGGSGIVVIKYNNIKSYRLRVKEKTYFTIVGAGTNNSRSLFLHGTYKIEISSTNTKIMKDASNSLSGITTLDIEGATNNELTISSNIIDITYNLRKSIADINKTQLSIPSGTAANIVSLYNAASGGIPFNNNKYNRYKITTNISKTYKITTDGVDNVNFNIELYTIQNGFISSNNYDIRYVFLTTSDTNVIIPIEIYITIKPISNISGAKIIVKTYSRTRLGTNEAEIFAFIGNETGSTSITDFNNITTWNTSFSDKDVWGIVAKTSSITTLESSKITVDNILTVPVECDGISQKNRPRICDVKDLVIIKNKINTETFTTTAPLLKEYIDITSSGLFLSSTTGSSILNYDIADYISYESATIKTPANRTSTFNILGNATKYVYFAIP
jgi:hypothetical protein